MLIFRKLQTLHPNTKSGRPVPFDAREKVLDPVNGPLTDQSSKTNASPVVVHPTADSVSTSINEGCRRIIFSPLFILKAFNEVLLFEIIEFCKTVC